MPSPIALAATQIVKKPSFLRRLIPTPSTAVSIGVGAATTTSMLVASPAVATGIGIGSGLVFMSVTLTKLFRKGFHWKEPKAAALAGLGVMATGIPMLLGRYAGLPISPQGIDCLRAGFYGFANMNSTKLILSSNTLKTNASKLWKFLNKPIYLTSKQAARAAKLKPKVMA